MPSRIFITSDWHLGGTADAIASDGATKEFGTQICRSTTQLTAFIDWVRSQAADENVELIINGDMVDFLAPESESSSKVWLGDELLAIEKLNRIVRMSRAGMERGPFDALQDFVARDNCSLTILLGNHDVELSLPAVRRHFSNAVLKTNGSRLEFLFDGEACSRAEGELLIEHGNRYDPLNALNFSRLRQERSHLSRKLQLREEERDETFFLPPYGTQLVVNVFNALLGSCPFLNLLKPETEAALPLVLALHPEWLPLLREAHRYFEIKNEERVNRLRHDAQPGIPGQISQGATKGYFKSFDDFFRRNLGVVADDFLRTQPADVAGQQSKKIPFNDRLSSLERRMSVLAAKTNDIVRSAFQKGHDWGDLARIRLARAALLKVRDEALFSIGTETNIVTYNAAKALAHEGKWKAVVFGHTHFPKEISFDGGARYLNCGTWADVMRLPVSVTNHDAGTSAELDDFFAAVSRRDLDQYFFRRLAFVEARLKDDGSLDDICLRFCNERTGIPQDLEGAKA